jgi:hypothetical protein
MRAGALRSGTNADAEFKVFRGNYVVAGDTNGNVWSQEVLRPIINVARMLHQVRTLCVARTMDAEAQAAVPINKQEFSVSVDVLGVPLLVRGLSAVILQDIRIIGF